jgi:pimeloyl-ACP methyl ester carboxylesterase
MRRFVLVVGLLAVVCLALGVGLPLVGAAPDLSALPPRDRSVAIGDEIELNVREVGAGAPIVLVHGLPSNIGDWAGVPDALAAHGHRVVVYDRAGYGWSSRPPVADGNYSLASNARDLGALLDQLGIERAALVGWSYGGGIVQTFALAHPERVSRLVLLGSVGPLNAAAKPDSMERLASSAIGPPLFNYVTSVPSLGRGVMEGALAEVFSGTENVPAGYLERSAAQMALPGTIDAWLAEQGDGGYGALRPESIQIPTLVLHGGDDHAVSVAIANDLAQRLPNDELVVVEGGSHMLPIMHPDLVASQVHAFAVKP